MSGGRRALKRDVAEQLVDRIRANAGRLKVRLAKGSCSPNLLVAFVDDGRSLLGDLRHRQPRMFSLVEAPELDELLTGAGPVRVWSNVEPRWANGAPLPRWRGKIKVPSPRGYASQMYLPTRTDIDSALVVFDRDAVLGMTLVQLADYATMRGLTHTRPASGDESMATILALFEEGGDGIDQLTSFDVGYLSSLYFDRPDVPAADKLLGVRKRAVKFEAEVPGT